MGVRTGRTAYGGRNAQAVSTEYYTDGNTVRVRRPEPVRVPARRRISRKEYERRVRLWQDAEKTESVSMSLPLTLILALMVAAVLFVGYNYLCLRSSIDMHMDKVNSLETELENMKTENDALERSIDTSVDLNHVYDVAVNELGMVRAGQNNVITYDKTESEYVRQYESIPAAER